MDIMMLMLLAIAVLALIGAPIIGIIWGILNPQPPLPTRMLTCGHCGYTWKTKHPHNIDNPPARCPKCGKKLQKPNPSLKQ